jgi:YesN/AraC family two-component response regulator
MSKVRIVVADDHAMMREGLTALISAEADMEVIGEAPHGRIAVELALALKPDVIRSTCRRCGSGARTSPCSPNSS